MKAITLITLFSVFTHLTYAETKDKRTSPEFSGLEQYKNTYFVLNDNDAKFQLSFKWQIVKDVPLFFGYTQNSVWDVFEDSSPFKSITFNPDFFYRFNIDFLNYSYIDLGVFEHNSNGRDGVESRSYNQTFLRVISKKVFKDGFGFVMENKFYAIYDEGEFNEDIREFLGYYEMTLRLQNIFKFAFDDEEFYLRYVPGKNGFSLSDRDYGFYNLGFSFRFQDSSLLPAFLIDYYSGFSESLIDYNKKTKEVRFGIMKSW